MAGHGDQTMQGKQSTSSHTPPPGQDNDAKIPGSLTSDHELSDDEIWMLIRRFNKEIYHVKSHRNALPHELDLTRIDYEPFSPEKLRTTIEWFYTSVVVNLVGLWRHIVHLRSWKTPRQTGAVCATYFSAWALDALTFTFFAMIIGFMLSPSLRSLCFPPPPEADFRTEDGDYLSDDSLTGTPEAHKGEAAELEADNLIRDIAEVAVESARTEYDDREDGAPHEGFFHTSAGQSSHIPDTKEDETKKPMMDLVAKWSSLAIRVIADVTETYEQLCNLFAPTPPFYVIGPRVRVMGLLAFFAVMSLVFSTYAVVKTGTLLLGVFFFGDPVFSVMMNSLSRRFPHWQEEFDMKKIFLDGVPTNAQLSLTLLRLGEMTASPLIPPPVNEKDTSSKAPNKATVLSSPPPELLRLDPSLLPFPGILKVVRFTIGIGVNLRLAMNRAIAIAGLHHPPHLIHLLRKRGWVSAPVGPLRFKAEFDHRRGTIVIDSSQEPPVLYFTTHQLSHVQDLRLSHQHKSSVLFQLPISDIAELKKTEQIGWKQKLILEFTGGIKYSVDGLIVAGKKPGQLLHITAIKERDLLFNRLVAMGAQYWESL